MGIKQFPISITKGNLGDVGTKSHIGEILIKYYEETKKLGLKISGLYFNMNPLLLVTDLDLIKRILIKDFDHFPNHDQFINEEDEPISAHLFNLKDERWRKMRNYISPVFTSCKLKNLFASIDGVADEMLSLIDAEISLCGHIDAKKVMSRFATDAIGIAAFGLECNSIHDEHADFSKMAQKVFSIQPSRIENFIMEKMPYIAKKLHLKYFTSEIEEFYINTVKNLIQHRIDNADEVRKDFIHFMVELYQKGELEIEQITAHSFLFFLGYVFFVQLYANMIRLYFISIISNF